MFVLGLLIGTFIGIFIGYRLLISELRAMSARIRQDQIKLTAYLKREFTAAIKDKFAGTH